MLDAPTTRSNRIDASVGAAGTNERWRGWSVEMHAGASTSLKMRSASKPADPRGCDGAPDHRPQLGGRARMVERRRLHPHAVDGVAHDRLGEHLAGAVVAVHRH